MSSKLSEFDYPLPKELIAQEPKQRRDESRLLVLNRKRRSLEEAIFKDIVNFTREGDVLVLNNTKVIPARLLGKRETGGKVEVLLLKEKEKGLWKVLVKPGKKAKIGETISFGEGKFRGEILKETENGGERVIRFNPPDIGELINNYGQMPLPPYIKKEIDSPNRYQTVYAEKEGAIAAPTAGFHFTGRLLKELTSRGVELVYITLHCGIATFRPVKTQDIKEHRMEAEFYEVAPETAETINRAKLQKRRIIAVGTTVVRTLETVGFINGEGIPQVRAKTDESKLYIYPGYEFKIIDSLITNFHLPCSTNLILVCAFAGRENIFKAYQYAIDKRFRFYSFGDAMLIL
jgi:S-adenosylmethionine:tRNA ribosyltransferase-isomerase